MPEAAPSHQTVRFGVFELDLRAGELRKQGVKVKLQEKPLQVLAILLEKPGEALTREELRQQLWAADTFVDFDHGLNIAISKLREALGDSAESPRFIETLPRHGYRFIAAVDSGLAVRDRREGRRWLAVVAVVAIVVFGAIVALNVAGLRGRLLSSGGPGSGVPFPKIESIAVLPFENLSADPGQEYFADGMTEELITDLGQISALRVISRTSVMQYKGTKKTIPEIGRELNADAIVESAVRQSGGQVRITTSLLYAPTDRHLWTQTYERGLGDVLVLQSEVARAIASQVKVKLTPQENARLARASPVDPEAHRLYLLGRFYWNKRTGEGFKKAVGFFQRAIENDPAYAPAYAGVADSYNMLGDWGHMRPRDAYPKAKAAARKALQIDDASAEAHTSLAMAHFEYDWDWAACEKEFQRAIELNPNYATAHQWYSDYLLAMRRHAASMTEAQRAEQLDPLSPMISAGVAFRYLYARRYKEAARRYQETVTMFPEFAPAWSGLGAIYEAKGMYQEAIGAYQKARSLSGASPAEVAGLGQPYAKGGIRSYYLWELQRLREESKHRYVRAVAFAWLLTRLGEKDQALTYLEKAYQDRDWRLALLQANTVWDRLRSDPRFQALLRRMNFPP